MFAKYFQSELTYLREMGKEYAQIHPSTAGLLSERGNDPDVERLLEGFAFLTARIYERLDDAAPIIIHNLTELLLPHYLRPLPATSIIQFTPSLKALRGVQTISRGKGVEANPISGTACQFQTCYDVDLLPIEIEDVDLDESIAARPVIRIQFQVTEAGYALVARPEGLRLFIQGEFSLASMVMLWLTRYCSGIRIKSGEATARLAPSEIEQVGFEPEHAVLPWPRFAPEGFRFLQEYFTLPQKFLFFDVRGLDAIEITTGLFEMEFEFERPPSLPTQLVRDTFRLHCTPVVNLFEQSATPIKVDPLVQEHMLRADGINPHHMEIHEIISVIGVTAGRRARREYQPFFSFAHSDAKNPEPAYYTFRRTRSPIDVGIDTYISVMSPRDVEPSMDEETLSMELICTNRMLPAELQIGDICKVARGSGISVPFSNITPVTLPIQPSLGSELHWKLLSHLAINQSSLAKASTLKALLALYNFQAMSESPAGRSNDLRIEAIRNVKHDSVTRLIDGAPVRGTRTHVELEESRYSSLGDAVLFASVVNELFANQVSINSFNQLTIQLHPSKEDYSWPVRNGRKTLI